VRLGVGSGTWELGEFCESRCCALARPRTRKKHCTRASQVIGIALESAFELSERVLTSSSENVECSGSGGTTEQRAMD
jgi:uncharacterized protein with NRDE domain